MILSEKMTARDRKRRVQTLYREIAYEDVMNSSIRIGRVFGIPIFLHLTFLLILPLFVWVFSEGTSKIMGITVGFGGLDIGTEVQYVFGTIAAVIFFATILAHELAHSYVAIKYGVKIRHITLMLFGGVASMEEIPRQPGQELKMAFAGPLTSLVIGFVSYLMMVIVEGIGSRAVEVEAIGILLGIIAFYNVLLAGFNLLPAFPMDGGRVLRSFLSTRMPHVEATKKAASVAKVLAAGMAFVGILFFNIFLIFIAFFVYIGAKEEEQATVISESLEGLTVRQLMSTGVQVVRPDMSVQQLLDLMLVTRRMGYPVIDNGIVGMVTLSDTNKVPKQEAHLRTVRDIMSTDVVTVPPGMPATEALKVMSKRSISRLPVVDASGVIVGIVTKKDFLRMVEIVEARKRGTAWGQPGWDQRQQQWRPPPPPQV
jgi:Zn-dependent protease/CBS domain-containing protein